MTSEDKGAVVAGLTEAMKGAPAGDAARIASLEALILDRGELENIRGALAAKIRRGLSKDGEEIKALPAYLPPPSPSIQGRSLVLDTGGTNMRAAVVEVSESGARVVDGPLKQKVPDGRDGKKVTSEDFFGAHRELVIGLKTARGLPIGYCFSYPSTVTPECDARLIKWTKGLEIEGVEGTLVGSALKKTLAGARLEPGAIAVLNDTVACLLGGAVATRGKNYSGVIGLIAGTGSNIASFFQRDRIEKLSSSVAWSGEMAVNLESGNFNPPHLTPWDDALDAESKNPGAQRFEKAASGYYLPYLFKKIMPQVEDFDPALGSSLLAQLRDYGPEDSLPGKVAGLLLDRAADLIAAALAAVVDVTDKPGKFGILAEGGLFWGISGFADRVTATLNKLLEGGPASAEILRLEDANLIGSACAALTKSK